MLTTKNTLKKAKEIENLLQKNMSLMNWRVIPIEKGELIYFDIYYYVMINGLRFSHTLTISEEEGNLFGEQSVLFDFVKSYFVTSLVIDLFSFSQEIKQ